MGKMFVLFQPSPQSQFVQNEKMAFAVAIISQMTKCFPFFNSKLAWHSLCHDLSQLVCTLLAVGNKISPTLAEY